MVTIQTAATVVFYGHPDQRRPLETDMMTIQTAATVVPYGHPDQTRPLEIGPEIILVFFNLYNFVQFQKFKLVLSIILTA